MEFLGLKQNPCRDPPLDSLTLPFFAPKKEDASGKKENVRAFNKPKMPECFFKKKLSESVCVPTPGVKNEIIVCVPRRPEE